MACLGELDIVKKTIEATAQMGFGTDAVAAEFEGIVAESLVDGTARAYLSWNKEVVLGEDSGGDVVAFSLNGDGVVVTEFDVTDVEATAEYCACNGLAY